MSGEPCSVPKCSRPATVLIEWGMGHGVTQAPRSFKDWFCQGRAAHMLGHEGPRRIDETGQPQALSTTAPDL